MVNILSIDFDYFIAASAMERDKYFPSGEDEVNLNKLRAIWKERYLQYPELMQIGVVDEFHSLKDFLLLIRIKREKFFSSNTHKSIKGVIDRIPANQNLRIVNIDFHHDYYHYYSGDNYLNCGNWLRRVIEERPMTQVKWIRREDSQLFSLEGEIPFEHTTNITSVFNESFDIVFICRSPEWSPPHLSYRYEELVRSVFYSETA